MPNNPASSTAVAVSGLSIERAGRRLFDEMSWQLPFGSFLAVTGPSGAGKSSLLSCLAGELGPSSGSVNIEAENIGCIFQDFRLSTNLSVLKNVLCGSLGRHSWWETLLKFDDTEREDAFEIASSLGLARLVHKPAATVSGGEQQRTAVARALLQRPDVILADEPTSQLDTETARLVLKKLRDEAKNGNTVIVVLHDSRLVEEFAEYELVVDSALARGWEFRKREGVAG
jgi:phosphonate transport system ATP-binding protein